MDKTESTGYINVSIIHHLPHKTQKEALYNEKYTASLSLNKKKSSHSLEIHL